MPQKVGIWALSYRLAACFLNFKPITAKEPEGPERREESE